jgi:hypothetical protein
MVPPVSRWSSCRRPSFHRRSRQPVIEPTAAITIAVEDGSGTGTISGELKA